MFNEAYHHSLELFSWPHLLALAIILTAIFTLFFTRKFFIKNRIADRCVRYTLAFLMLFFELVPYFRRGPRSVSTIFTTNYPLCGQLLWISAIALIANSERIEKLIYPLCILGATMSLMVLDLEYTFPHFTAFQFFFTHGTFLIGALYFVFTRKINKYTLKDFGKSCLLLFGVSCLIMMNTFARQSVLSGENVLNQNGLQKFTNDSWFVISPPKELMAIKDALGQVGYTIAYVVLVSLVLFAIYGFTYLGTKKRNQDINYAVVNDNKVIRTLTKLTSFQRYVILGVCFGVAIYLNTLAIIASIPALYCLDAVLTFIVMIMTIINEVVVNYNNQNVRLVNNNNSNDVVDTTKTDVIETTKTSKKTKTKKVTK